MNTTPTERDRQTSTADLHESGRPRPSESG